MILGNLAVKFCAFWLKPIKIEKIENWNLTFEIFEKILKFTLENWVLTHFLSALPGPLSFYTDLENNPFFYNNFFAFFWGRGNLPPFPAGAPGIYFSRSSKHPRKFGQRLWKKSNFHRDFIKKFQSFQTILLRFLIKF